MDSLDDWIRWGVGGLAAALVGLWRVINGKADRTELVAYMKEAREARQNIDRKLDDVSKATQQTAVCVARLEGQIKNRPGA